MPSKNPNKRAARKARKGAGGRKKERKPICEVGGKRDEDPTPVIANSIYDLKLKEKPGPEVFCSLQHIERKELERLYRDLSRCYERAHYLVYNEKLDNGLPLEPTPIGLRLYCILNGFKRLLPQDFHLNIEDINGKEFCFFIYAECVWPEYWHFLPVGDAIKKLYKTNRRLHDLFLSFLRLMNDNGINLWYGGAMGMAQENIRDDFQNVLEDMNPVDEIDFLAEVADYKKGEANKYLSKIKRAPKLSAKEIKNKAARYSQREVIANLIYQGACLYMEGFSLWNYNYIPVGDVDSSFLELDCQCNIIWKENDFLFRVTCDYLDSMAQEGMQYPVVSLKVDSKTKEIDFGKLSQMNRFPKLLSDFMSRASDLIKTYIKAA